MAPRLGSLTASRDNNFDVLRLVAAGLVLTSHSWALTGRPEPGFAGDTFGGIGVCVFFAISGFLVSRSWHFDPRARAYIVKRFLRLWPALAVVVVLCAFALGPLTTTFPLESYVSETTREYVVSNARLITRYALPGVFADNPSGAVNGSLWTLPVEVKAYGVLLVLGLCRLISRPVVLLTLAAGLVWFLAVPVSSQPERVADWIGGTAAARCLLLFLGGALLWAMRDRIRLDWRLAVVAALAWSQASRLPLAASSLVWALTVPYMAVAFAYSTSHALRRLTRPGDLSYGLYLYAFPVQQTIVLAWGATIAPVWLLLVAGPVTYALAFCSWRLVEAPALGLKHRLPLVQAPAAA